MGRLLCPIMAICACLIVVSYARDSNGYRPLSAKRGKSDINQNSPVKTVASSTDHMPTNLLAVIYLAPTIAYLHRSTVDVRLQIGSRSVPSSAVGPVPYSESLLLLGTGVGFLVIGTGLRRKIRSTSENRYVQQQQDLGAKTEMASIIGFQTDMAVTHFPSNFHFVQRPGQDHRARPGVS